MLKVTVLSEDDHFNLATIFFDTPQHPMDFLYCSLRNFMLHPSIYQQQHFRQWWFSHHDAEEKIRIKIKKAKLMKIEEQAKELLANERKYILQPINDESLSLQLENRLQYQVLERKILKHRDKIDEKRRWLRRLLKKSTQKQDDQTTLLNLTDYFIIERWCAGGSSRGLIDDLCSQCIDAFDKHVVKQEKQITPVDALIERVPPQFKLAYACAQVFYNLINLLNYKRKINMILLEGREPLLSVQDVPYSPPKDMPQTEHDDKEIVIPYVKLSEDLTTILMVQLASVQNKLIETTKLLHLLKSEIRVLNSQIFAEINVIERAFIQDTLEIIQKAEEWIGGALTPLMRIITETVTDPNELLTLIEQDQPTPHTSPKSHIKALWLTPGPSFFGHMPAPYVNGKFQPSTPDGPLSPSTSNSPALETRLAHSDKQNKFPTPRTPTRGSATTRTGSEHDSSQVLRGASEQIKVSHEKLIKS